MTMTATANPSSPTAATAPPTPDREVAEEERWTAVSRSRSQSECHPPDPSGLSKSARKNLRRKEKRQLEKGWGARADRAENSRTGNGGEKARSKSFDERRRSGGNASSDDDNDNDDGCIDRMTSPHDDEAIRRALAASLEDSSSPVHPPPDDDCESRKKRLRNLRKKIAAAEALPRGNSGEMLGEDRRAKLDRLPSLRSRADGLRDEILAIETARTTVEAARKAEAARDNDRRIAEWTALSDGSAVEGYGAGVDNDNDEFACPLCAGPLEAAASCVPCRHVFCRGCLEDALGAAADRTGGDPKSVRCPLCRASLFDAANERMLVEPAVHVKKKMRKRKCKCKCGTEMALSSLRAHLRDCTQAAPGLFGDDTKKKLGHEFRRPNLDQDKVDEMAGRKKKTKQPVRTARVAQLMGWVGESYDEDAALQAALAMSSLER